MIKIQFVKVLVFLIICVLVPFTSCTHIMETPFTCVIDYYSDDSAKAKAAAYLERSSSFHYGVSRHIVDSAGHVVTNLSPEAFKTDSAYKAYIDSMGYCMKTGWAIRDVDTITENFLKENIELAFDSWKNPWSKDVSFPDFCKYILPYRNVDEELSDWRRMMKERYEPSIKDSVEHPECLKDVAEYVMREIKRDVHYSTWLRKVYDSQYLTPMEMLKIGGLECRACAHYTTLAFRACGIPCSMIELHWRFTEVPHTSVLVPSVGGNERAFRINVGDTLIYMGEAKDTMAVWRAWAFNYSPNIKLIKLSEDESIPPSFLHPLTREDITSQVSTTCDFAMPLSKDKGTNEHVFLCRFHEWNWYPVREGEVRGDSVYFHDATIRQWYRMGLFHNEGVQTFGDTFTLLGGSVVQSTNNTGDSAVFNIDYSADLKNLSLTRKDTLCFWGADNRWNDIYTNANLWGYIEKNNIEEPYNKKNCTQYIALFYRLNVRQPYWTIFYNNHMGRPVGALGLSPGTDEVRLMDY